MSRLLACLQMGVLSAGLALAGALPRQAPPLTVMTTKGDSLSLESLHGKVVLLEFFLTTCPHCQASTGVIMPIYKQWKPRGLEVVAIAIDNFAAMKADPATAIGAFIQQYGTTYPTSLGTLDTVKLFTGSTHFYVPYMLLIDRAGKIRYEHPGTDQPFFQAEDANLRNELNTLLTEPAPRRTSARPIAKVPVRSGPKS